MHWTHPVKEINVKIIGIFVSGQRKLLCVERNIFLNREIVGNSTIRKVPKIVLTTAFVAWNVKELVVWFFNILAFWPTNFRWTLQRHVSKWFSPFSVWCYDWAMHFDHSPPMLFFPMIYSKWSSLQGDVVNRPLERSVHLFECNNFAIFGIVYFVWRWHCLAAIKSENKIIIEFSFCVWVRWSGHTLRIAALYLRSIRM